LIECLGGKAFARRSGNIAWSGFTYQRRSLNRFSLSYRAPEEVLQDYPLEPGYTRGEAV
jgi:hypothetical protein